MNISIKKFLILSFLARVAITVSAANHDENKLKALSEHERELTHEEHAYLKAVLDNPNISKKEKEVASMLLKQNLATREALAEVKAAQRAIEKKRALQYRQRSFILENWGLHKYPALNQSDKNE